MRIQSVRTKQAKARWRWGSEAYFYGTPQRRAEKQRRDAKLWRYV